MSVTKNLCRHHLYLHSSMFTSARYTYAKIMYKCYIYIKSIGYTINWEYIQKHNIILTKYLVTTIEYLVDFMSKQDRTWLLFLSNYDLTKHFKHFRMKWALCTPLPFFYSDFYDDLEKKHTLDQGFILLYKSLVRPIHKECKWYLGHFLFDLVIFQCDYYILISPIDVNTSFLKHCDNIRTCDKLIM